mmetsp:Transcript_56886/g.66492  ORF Transcript_56886/g.66492 Transcript_56886/m.66492 type:complete len:602 (+) Transcript_56886:55-1860(+)
MSETRSGKRKNVESIASSSCNESQPSYLAIIPLITFCITVAAYLIPLLKHHPHHEAVLDEMHILGDKQDDVTGTSTLYDVFINDYWGRPMSKSDSHKSYRPFAILSFRYFNLGHDTYVNSIFWHRMITVILHAGLSQMVSILTILLYPLKSKTTSSLLQCISALLFGLHPTHVEAVANAANRHIVLALISSVLVSDDAVGFRWVLCVYPIGLLCSETAIFQMPAILCTMTAIKWKRTEKSITSLATTVGSLVPRYVIILLCTLAYYVGRAIFDTFSIPDGLIRPAENPFHGFSGMKRTLNYSIVLSIHVLKSFSLDPIGSSHEYGYDCIPEISGNDWRLCIPAGLLLLLLVIIVQCLRKGVESTVMLIVALSWMATLFPVSGLVKVGTFVADRIVVASSVVLAVFGARFLVHFILGNQTSTSSQNSKSRSRPLTVGIRSSLVAAGIVFMGYRVMHRSGEWMTSPDLLESSLKACPRSAKSNLEISKIYSGLYPEKLDMELAKTYIEKAEEIDPEYCDIHWQWAQLLFRQQRYLEFEGRLTKAVTCPFTTGGAYPLFEQYWGMVTQDPNHGAAAVKRRAEYVTIIQAAVAEAKDDEERSLKK